MTQVGQVVRFDLDKGDFRFRIGADQFALKIASVMQRDRDTVGISHNVIVGQDIAVPGDQKPGALAPPAKAARRHG